MGISGVPSTLGDDWPPPDNKVTTGTWETQSDRLEPSTQESIGNKPGKRTLSRSARTSEARSVGDLCNVVGKASHKVTARTQDPKNATTVSRNTRTNYQLNASPAENHKCRSTALTKPLRRAVCSMHTKPQVRQLNKLLTKKSTVTLLPKTAHE